MGTSKYTIADGLKKNKYNKPSAKKETTIIYSVYENQVVFVNPEAKVTFNDSALENHEDKFVFVAPDRSEYDNVRQIFEALEKKDNRRLQWFYEKFSTKGKSVSTIDELFKVESEEELATYFFDYDFFRKITFPRFIAYFLTRSEAEEFIKRNTTLFPNRFINPYIIEEEIDLRSAYLLFLTNFFIK